MDFHGFHEILFWPLELSSKDGLTPDFLNKWVDETVAGGSWRLLDPYDRETTETAELRYSEFLYFHPFIRRFLYPSATDTQSLRILKRDDVHGVRVKVAKSNFEGSLKVNRVHLYLFHTHVAILVVEVAAKNPIDRVSALNFLEQFRRAYAPYWASGKARHCPESVQWLDGDEKPLGVPDEYGTFEDQRLPVENKEWRRPPVSAHWRWLLAGLEPSSPPEARKDRVLYFDQIEDERMPSMAFMTTADPHNISDADMKRLCFLDEAPADPEEDTYSPLFLEDFRKRYCYDRYWDDENEANSWMSTRYLCCGYAFTVLGSSESPFVCDEASGILAHFRHHYFQLGLLAHFHRASLLQFSRRYAESVQSERGTKADLNQEFATFVTGSWFNEVSNQMQGSELFELWSHQLGNQRLLEHVMREKGLAAELEEAAQIKHDGTQVRVLTESLARLTHLLVPLTIVAVLVAWVDMDFTRYHLDCLREGRFWWVFGISLILIVATWYGTASRLSVERQK